MSARRVQRIVAALALGGLLALGSPAIAIGALADLLQAGSVEGKYLSANVHLSGSALSIDTPAGATTQQLDEGWRVQVSHSGSHVGLLRESGTGMQLRLLAADGSPLGERFFSAGMRPLVTDRGIVTHPHTIYEVPDPHRLGFYASNGQLVREVEEPELSLKLARLMPGGRVLTLSHSRTAGEVSFIAYDPLGDVSLRHVVYDAQAAPILSSSISPDGRRLIYLQALQQPLGAVRLSLIDHEGRVVAQHRIGSVTELAVSSDSSLLAVLGRHSLQLYSLLDGSNIWRVSQRLGYAAMDGVRFSEQSEELFVVASLIDVASDEARARCYRVALSDGEIEHYELGRHPMHAGLRLLDIRILPGGELRLLLPRHEIRIPAQAGQGVTQ